MIPSCHGPAIHRPMSDEAFTLIRQVPDLPRWDEPGQADLEAMLTAAGAMTEAAASTAGA